MTDIHEDQPLATAGATLEDADTAMILLHGRGATADSILQMAGSFPQNEITFLAPQAADRTWYPNSFLAPEEDNEPHLSSALNVIRTLIRNANNHSVKTDRIALLGFSQGACLAMEYAARNPSNYLGIVGFSGGLIGAEIHPSTYDGDMEKTPVFLGCSDQDPYIPMERVNESAAIFEDLNAAVEKRIYEGMGHTVNEDELRYAQELLS